MLQHPAFLLISVLGKTEFNVQTLQYLPDERKAHMLRT